MTSPAPRPLTILMQKALYEASRDPAGQYDAGSTAKAGGRTSAARGLVQRGFFREVRRCVWEITDAGRQALRALR